MRDLHEAAWDIARELETSDRDSLIEVRGTSYNADIQFTPRGVDWLENKLRKLVEAESKENSQ